MKTKQKPHRLASNKAKKDTSDAAKKSGAAAKAAGDKALIEIATALPHGSGKEFLVVNKEMDDIEEQRSLLAKRWRGCRARLKEMKIELRPFDHVRKLRKMEPEDMQSFEASVALYKDQLSMNLSIHQQVLKKEIVDRREAARDFANSSGADTGKEVGSGAVADDDKPVNRLPEKNENFRASVPSTAVN